MMIQSLLRNGLLLLALATHWGRRVILVSALDEEGRDGGVMDLGDNTGLKLAWSKSAAEGRLLCKTGCGKCQAKKSNSLSSCYYSKNANAHHTTDTEFRCDSDSGGVGKDTEAVFTCRVYHEDDTTDSTLEGQYTVDLFLQWRPDNVVNETLDDVDDETTDGILFYGEGYAFPFYYAYDKAGLFDVKFEATFDDFTNTDFVGPLVLKSSEAQVSVQDSGCDYPYTTLPPTVTPVPTPSPTVLSSGVANQRNSINIAVLWTMALMAGYGAAALV